MYRFALGLSAVVLLTGFASGQLVQLGPDGGVRINAPFVRVEVGPAGNTYVRAPFTSVYAPGRRFIGPPWQRGPAWQPVYHAEPLRSEGPREASLPVGERLAEMSWRERRQLLRGAARQLTDELNQLADGQIWQDYLRPAALFELVSVDTDRPPTRVETAQFQSFHQTFAATLTNPQLQRITGSPGFRAVLTELRPFVAEPAPSASTLATESTLAPTAWPDTLRRRLAASATRLDQQLGLRGAAATFRSYLELPLEVYAGAGRAVAGQGGTVPDLAQLEFMLQRYDRVSRSPEYKEVAALDSFRSTRRLLSEYVINLQEAGPAEPAPRPELLPSPEPVPNGSR